MPHATSGIEDDIVACGTLPKVPWGLEELKEFPRDTTLIDIRDDTDHLDAYHAPFPPRTAAGVRKRMSRSVHSDRVRAYWRSSRTISSNVVRLRPLTCHSPVMPGMASRSVGGARAHSDSVRTAGAGAARQATSPR